MFALGAGAGPELARHVGKRRAEIRTGLLALIGVVALAILPLFFSERYTNHALRTAGSDLSGAYSALGRAVDLNPFAARPLASEAVIAEKAGDRERALAALEQAQEREPEEWTLYFLEARVLGPTDPEAASAALARARELNPDGPELKGLERKSARQPVTRAITVNAPCAGQPLAGTIAHRVSGWGTITVNCALRRTTACGYHSAPRVSGRGRPDGGGGWLPMQGQRNPYLDSTQSR